jgi:hypothetical protein
MAGFCSLLIYALISRFPGHVFQTLFLRPLTRSTVTNNRLHVAQGVGFGAGGYELEARGCFPSTY